MHSTPGNARPTVFTRLSILSEVVVIVQPGDASVCPKTMTISRIFILSMTFFITSMGQGEPAIMPVLRLEKSKLLNCACSSIAMNIVGTPCTAVHFSTLIAFMTGTGLYLSTGTIVVP